MSEKKTRNKFKDTIWDYYETNRKITKQYDEEYKKTPGKKPWTRNEKLYLIIIIVAVIVGIIRFTVF